MSNSLYLPSRSLVKMTNEEDPVDYYYHWLTAAAYKKRLLMALNALGDGHFSSLLEVGFGSGILLPELARRTKALYGVETHGEIEAVRHMLRAEGIKAELDTGSILSLSYDTNSFEGVVCLSVLEHMNETELPIAVSELKRVASKDGVIVTGFPVRNVATDVFYRIVGFRPRDIHPSSHRDIINEMKNQIGQVTITTWPSLLPLDLSLYVVCRCING